MFDKLVWQKDRFVVDGLVFRLEDQKDDTWELGEECFPFLKTRRILDQYAAFLAMREDFRPRRILELGIYQGASLAFWFEHFSPEKIVGVDIVQGAPNPYFQRYVEDRVRAGRIKTYWGTDQSDYGRMREIVATEFGDGLDLIIDDASHLYRQTKVSFETLFPLLRPGGLYIIEDWSWACWPDLPIGQLPVGTELPAFVFQLVEATGTMDRSLIGTGSSQTLRPLIASLAVYPDFVVIERGEAEVSMSKDFQLEKIISRSIQLSRIYSPAPPFWRPAVNMLHRIWRRGRRIARLG